MKRWTRSLLSRYSKRSLLYITIIIFNLDIVFVAINYHASQAALNKTLTERAVDYQEEFKLTLNMTYRNMMQMALFISQNQNLNQLFLKAKKAIAKEGGGAGGKEAQRYRQALLERVKPAWDKMTQAFDVRQLHYHLGPGSLSFLRVHKPEKYGDRMDTLRHIIVDSNAEKTPRFGFETGRIYSGLRGVYPITTIDPSTGKPTHVGVLETGTSFKQLLPLFTEQGQMNIAVLLTKSHIENKMWPEFIKEYFQKNPDIDYYIEASSSKNTKTIINKTNISPDFQTYKAEIIKFKDDYFSVYYFPLYDYQASQHAGMPPSGFILVWENVTDLIEAFHGSFITNLLFSAFAFVIIELALIWLFERERRLKIAKMEAHIDPLTGIANRRKLNLKLKKELSRSARAQSPLSVIMIDIDFFKRYNDTYGHEKGDECLKQVAQSMKGTLLHKDDLLGRYGGEEFMAVLPNTTLEKALPIAQRMQQAVEDLNIPHTDSECANHVSLSLGVASNEGAANSEDLTKQADQNLYKAKQSGRNQVYPS